MTDDGPSHADREHRARVFSGVLAAVEGGGSEKPGMAAGALYNNRVSQADLPLPAVKRAIRAACENDELVRIHDRDGTLRYVTTDEETLRRTVAWLADADNANREDIAKCNQLLHE